MTAAPMKRMMQGVILAQHSTGKAARLEGYSAAGKTGTGQKIDPATHAYSRTKYVASFAGFAPVNDPAVTVAVILDSPVGLHQGGQVSAPVFQRVAQQVLEYLHTPHDVELPSNRQVLLAERRVKDQDVEEGSPDRLGDSLEATDADTDGFESSAGRCLRQADTPGSRQRCDACGLAPASTLRASSSRARANCDVGRQTARSDASGTSSIERHDRTGCRAGRNRSAIVPGQERQDRNRDGAGKRTGPGRRRQRPGPPAIASAGIARSIGIAGDSEVRTINTVMHPKDLSS